MRRLGVAEEAPDSWPCQTNVMNPEPQLCARAALIGMRSNAGPLDNVAVSFGPSVTALYGQNGAGKTWILSALKGALRGRYKGITQLICQFERGTAVFNWVLERLADDVHEHRYASSATIEEDRALLRGAVEKWFAGGGRFFKPYTDAREVPADFVNELLSATSIALIPTGSEAAEWDVWLCLSRDASGFPVGARQVAAYHSAVKEAEDFAQRIAAEDDSWRDGGEEELSDDEYDAKMREEEKQDQELSSLEWEYIYQPLAGIVWEYSRSTQPQHVRGMLDRCIHDELPIPVVRLFAARSIPLVLEVDDDESDIDSVTRTAFAKRFQNELNSTEGVLTLSEEMKQWAAHRNEAANEIYDSLLQDAPLLTLELRPPGRWITDGPLHWCVQFGEYAFQQVPVRELSRAENRWACVAVRRALDETASATALIIDEPEAALHRSAERHMARGLSSVTTFGPQVIVATHSPEVLDASTTECIHVKKSEGKTGVGTMPAMGPNALAELGLSPSDLLGLYRVFLLVEGEHDEIVIRALCGDILEQARVKIIPIRGGRNLPSSIESQVLFDLSDAHLVAVLDNVRAEEIKDTWLEAQTRFLSGGADDSIEFLSKAFSQRKGDEYGWITKWLSRALKHGVHGRIDPFGLAARDIIEYLPVEALIPNAGKTWDELRMEHDLALPNLDRSKGLHDFKRWLTKAYGADTSVSSVRRAAADVESVPEEFQKLGYRLREIGARPRMR